MRTEKMSEITRIRKLLTELVLLKEVLTLNEAATYLRISPGYLYRITCNSKISHYVPFGKKIVFRRKDLDMFLSRSKKLALWETEQGDCFNVQGRGIA
jgi:excisionase family DNA binding protein